MMSRPSLEPILVASPRNLNTSLLRDCSPTTTSDVPTLPTTSEQSYHSLQSPLSRRRQPSRRQFSISYLPADSPRLWSPRSPSLSSTDNGKKEGHARTRSISHQAASEPVVLTLAERHADLLQVIAQKESECLELRSQLAVHESGLLELKHKWERIVRREFGLSVPSTSTASALANTGSTVVLNGLVGGVRALAAATTSPVLVGSPTTGARGALSSSSPFAKRMTRQMASNSISSTTTAVSSSAPSTDGSPRLSQSSISSVAEEKADVNKMEDPVEEIVVSQNSGVKPASPINPGPAIVARQQQRQQGRPTPLEQPPSPSSKMPRRRPRDLRVSLADAPKPPLDDSSHPGSGKRASISMVSPTSGSIPGIQTLSAIGFGRANLGEAAQGLVDTVGSKLAELQRGQTFSKSQKRASVLLSDVSHSIFSALAPGSTGNAAALPTQSLIDENDDDATSPALGRALLPDVVAVSARPAPSTPESKDEEDEDWNW